MLTSLERMVSKAMLVLVISQVLEEEHLLVMIAPISSYGSLVDLGILTVHRMKVRVLINFI